METSEYLKDDCLVMHCTVGVVKTRFEGSKEGVVVPISDMGRDFKDLFESQVGCDIVFKVKSESFRAHKLILAARSPVFRAQFFGLVGDPSLEEVVVEDIEPFIFKVGSHIILMYLNSEMIEHSYTMRNSILTPIWDVFMNTQTIFFFN